MTKEEGIEFTEEIRRDVEATVGFGERGLTIGHKIGKASGCFQTVLLLGLSATVLTVAAVTMLMF